MVHRVPGGPGGISDRDDRAANDDKWTTCQDRSGWYSMEISTRSERPFPGSCSCLDHVVPHQTLIFVLKIVAVVHE